jgi:hypothetical protein
VAVALRYVVALDVNGQPAPIAIVRDGGKVPAIRFSALHSEQPTNKRAVVAVWIRVAEGLDDAAFAQFRKTCAETTATFHIDGDVADVSIPTEGKALRLTANLKTETRLSAEGGFDTSVSILSINGRDLGQEILGSTR